MEQIEIMAKPFLFLGPRQQEVDECLEIAADTLGQNPNNQSALEILSSIAARKHSDKEVQENGTAPLLDVYTIYISNIRK
jgi:hypothetical protein